MEEERDLVIGFRATMVADDDSAEQTAIYLRDVHVVIVERPGADRVLGHVENINTMFVLGRWRRCGGRSRMSRRTAMSRRNQCRISTHAWRLCGSSSPLHTCTKRRSPGEA